LERDAASQLFLTEADIEKMRNSEAGNLKSEAGTRKP
jgi:hypothetical protein